MLQPRPDLQEKLIASLKAGLDELPSEGPDLLDPFQYVASANYVVPMLLDLAISQGNEVVDAIPRYSSPDHAAVWSALLSAVSRFDAFHVPYFDTKLAADPFAEELLRHERNRLGRKHAAASFEQGLWRLVEDRDGLRIHLEPSARRSALHLVANKADFLASSASVQRLLRETNGDNDMEEFVLAAGLDAVTVLRKSCPAAWDRLAAELPFRVNVVPLFRAFLMRLSRVGSRWNTRDDLWAYWCEFAEKRNATSVDRAEMDALIDFHALTPQEGMEWGLQAAFIRFGETFATWPFVFHVLHPDLNFLALLVRRHETLWSRTIGADLALVADRMAVNVPGDGRFLARARRKRKRVGEVDLALLDQETGDVLVLELKTVFDKFRTHVQLSNYTEQRVNFSKAIRQARTAADAIRRGDWSLRDLFGKTAPTTPRSVTPGLLTWWDIYNPTLDSDDPIICSNFGTFEYLLSESVALTDVVIALKELSQIYCPGVLVDGSALIDEKKVNLRREVQTDVLPPLNLAKLGSVTREVLSDIPQVPDTPTARDVSSSGQALFTYKQMLPDL